MPNQVLISFLQSQITEFNNCIIEKQGNIAQFDQDISAQNQNILYLEGEKNLAAQEIVNLNDGITHINDIIAILQAEENA